MDRYFHIMLALVAAFYVFVTYVDVSDCEGGGDPAYRKQEVLVKFNKDISPEEAAQISETLGSRVIKKMGRLYLIRIPDGETVPNMVEQFSALPQVEYAEPNYVYSIQK